MNAFAARFPASAARGAPSARMSTTDRAAWRSARTLADLGELTARWLEGEIISQPGYEPGCGPAEETAPLVPVLAALNRAGFVTAGSQPGCDEADGNGIRWEQRAAVDGFAARRVAQALGDAAGAADLIVIARPPGSLPRWRYRYDRAVTVTRRGGQHYTYFGVHLPRRHIRDPRLGYGICHPDAVKALCSAWQVTVIDPGWGRPDVLWQVLEAAVAACAEGSPR